MSQNKALQARLAVVAEFPRDYFIENIVVRRDNSALVSVLNKRELWFVPAQQRDEVTKPLLLYTFQQNTSGIVEIEPDVFILLCSNWYTTHESFAYRIDLRAWQPGEKIRTEMLCQFPENARALNGCCLIEPGVILVADAFAGLIWRMDLPIDGSSPRVRVWLEHESMSYFPGTMKPEQPGVNGLRFASTTNHLYYSSTAKKLLMRIQTDRASLDPVGAPELVVAGRMGDDFCLDEDAQVLYLTTHRQNTLDIVSMDPGLNSGFTQSVAGHPFTEELIGPSSVAWRRGPTDYGRVAFITSDGGTASPAYEGLQTAKLLKVELQPVPTAFPGSTRQGDGS